MSVDADRSGNLLERRDRPGHALVLEIRDDGGNATPLPVRCRVCGSSLMIHGEGAALAHHLRGSSECRESISRWLEQRRESRLADGGDHS